VKLTGNESRERRYRDRLGLESDILLFPSASHTTFHSPLEATKAFRIAKHSREYTGLTYTSDSCGTDPLTAPKKRNIVPLNLLDPLLLWACTDCIFCCQPTISMSRVSRLAGVEFAFFSRPCPTSWTRNRQYLLSGTFPHGPEWRVAAAKTVLYCSTPEPAPDLPGADTCHPYHPSGTRLFSDLTKEKGGGRLLSLAREFPPSLLEALRQDVSRHGYRLFNIGHNWFYYSESGDDALAAAACCPARRGS